MRKAPLIVYTDMCRSADLVLGKTYFPLLLRDLIYFKITNAPGTNGTCRGLPVLPNFSAGTVQTELAPVLTGHSDLT